MTSGIYAILNTVNGKVYVGSSQNAIRRLARHRNLLSQRRHNNVYLQRSWDKDGGKAFSFGLLEVCCESCLLEREQHYIDLYGSMSAEGGYNLRGADRWGEITEETRQKMSIALRGNKNAQGSNPSLETRRKLSAAQKARTQNPKWWEKVSNYWRGRKREPFTVEHRLKMSEARKGRKHSKEVRLRIAASQREAWKRRKEGS